MVRWLVIGIGDVTRKRVLPAILAEPRSQLYGVLTRDPAKAQPYAGVRVFTTLDGAVQDPAIDAVYVASPVALHASQTIASLRAGKHVLGEKPAAMNYCEAESMAQAARASGRLWGIAYYRRLYPKLLRTRELIAQGAIGRRCWPRRIAIAGSLRRREAGCGIRRSPAEGRSTTPAPTGSTLSIFCSDSRGASRAFAQTRCTS
jgi:predicted dehydrogenase